MTDIEHKTDKYATDNFDLTVLMTLVICILMAVGLGWSIGFYGSGTDDLRELRNELRDSLSVYAESLLAAHTFRDSVLSRIILHEAIIPCDQGIDALEGRLVFSITCKRTTAGRFLGTEIYCNDVIQNKTLLRENPRVGRPIPFPFAGNEYVLTPLRIPFKVGDSTVVNLIRK